MPPTLTVSNRIFSVISSFFSPLVRQRTLATKSKTNKSAAKRFTRLEDDSYLYKQAGRNHNFAKKSGNYRSAHKRPGITNKVTTKLLDKIIANSQ